MNSRVETQLYERCALGTASLLTLELEIARRADALAATLIKENRPLSDYAIWLAAEIEVLSDSPAVWRT